MDPINFEIAGIIERRIEKKIEQCISIRSVEAIIVPEFEKASQDKNKPQLFNETKNLRESIKFLRAATKEREEVGTRLDELRSTLHQSDLGQECLGSHSGVDTTTGALQEDSNSRGPKHMDLFYGPPNAEGLCDE